MEEIAEPTGHISHCPSSVPLPVVYTTKETAKILNVSTSTLRRWRSLQPRRGLAYVRIEGRIGYRREDVLDYLNSHRTTIVAAA
ncbi:helix-turn-helix domain-containing protein [Kitasatospora sp. NPDC059795]|uniref:helix-turn-helix domain-containing protein n=1 Tax=Kitasatospora sp. NPDC059795 TaxID=3346949 RepID=UPI00364A5094